MVVSTEQMVAVDGGSSKKASSPETVHSHAPSPALPMALLGFAFGLLVGWFCFFISSHYVDFTVSQIYLSSPKFLLLSPHFSGMFSLF